MGILGMFEYFSAALRGPSQARWDHQRLLESGAAIRDGIAALEAAGVKGDADDPERPIFLLSAGWRSGSTMAQRLIMSSRKVLMWGEPYDECGLIQAMASSSRAFRAGWPPEEYFYRGQPLSDLSGSWIANLFPDLESWRAGQRALFDRMFSKPAQAAGVRRWGIKEVRLSGDHAFYLRWLYPNARFVFLYRNPLDAYRSYRRYGSNWYDVFPDRPVLTPRYFGRHWADLTQSFLVEAETLGALVVRYEDLIANEVWIDRLESHLEIDIDRTVLRNKVGSSKEQRRQVQPSYLERWLLRRAVSPTAEKTGYKF